jgi:hypothetical protein
MDCLYCEGRGGYMEYDEDEGDTPWCLHPCTRCDNGQVTTIHGLWQHIYEKAPKCITYERRLWRRNGQGKREFGYYYCGWWCFITNQRFCNKPSKRMF